MIALRGGQRGQVQAVLSGKANRANTREDRREEGRVEREVEEDSEYTDEEGQQNYEDSSETD